MREGFAERPWEGLVARLALGSREFVEQLIEQPRSAAAGDELKAATAPRPSFAQVVKAIERVKRQPWEAFAERHGDWGRDLALHLGREVCGLSLPELGAQAGGRSGMAVSMALRRLRGRLCSDETLAAALRRAKTELARAANC